MALTVVESDYRGAKGILKLKGQLPIPPILLVKEDNVFFLWS